MTLPKKKLTYSISDIKLTLESCIHNLPDRDWSTSILSPRSTTFSTLFFSRWVTSLTCSSRWPRLSVLLALACKQRSPKNNNSRTRKTKDILFSDYWHDKHFCQDCHVTKFNYTSLNTANKISSIGIKNTITIVVLQFSFAV